jgi:hypothetical protein
MAYIVEQSTNGNKLLGFISTDEIVPGTYMSFEKARSYYYYEVVYVNKLGEKYII